MICCEVCKCAGEDDICKETGSRIEWDVFGITVMKDCPERPKLDCENCLDGGTCGKCKNGKEDQNNGGEK